MEEVTAVGLVELVTAAAKTMTMVIVTMISMKIENDDNGDGSDR